MTLPDREVEVKRIRHIAKTFSWRVIGTIDTFLLSWAVTGKLSWGFSISGLELITKTILYYAHERMWYKSDFGLKKREDLNNPKDQ